MTDEYVHGKVQEALERQAEVRELERMAKLLDEREGEKE